MAIPLVLFLASFAAFAFLAPDSFLNGDMPVYAEQIRNADFSQRTTHIGYYLIGYAANYLPLPLDHALNLLSALVAAGTIVVVNLLALAITKDAAAALAGALVLLVNDALLINAIHAEVYAAQTFFAVSALLAWVRQRPLAAGASFAVAFLISPSSAFFLPAFPLLKRDLRSVALAGLSASIITVAVLGPHIDNYLFGARGLSAAAGKGVDFTLATLKNGRDIFFGFYALTPVLIAGTVIGIRAFPAFTASVALAWLVTFLFGEKFSDVPVQLPVYCLAAILAGIGVVRLREAGRVPMVLSGLAAVAVIAVVLFFPVPARIADHLPSTALLLGFAAACLIFPLAWKQPLPFVAAAWLATGILAFSRVYDTARETDSFARSAIETFSKAPPGSLFVGDWNALMRFNWNARRMTYTDDMAYPEDTKRIDAALAEGRPVWSVRRDGIAPLRKE